jgi:1-acyl-sn-glycerol-3-phosphate acyltransferase
MISKINYAWRVLATGLCFVCFGLGALLFSITVFPLIRTLPIESKRRTEITQLLIHKSFRLFTGMMQVTGVLDITIIDADNLANADNHLIVANHPCLLDVVLIISLIRKTGCVVKRTLWLNPFTRGAVSSAGYISNSDSREVVDECIAHLRGGSSLIVFPEGTRTTPGAPLKFHRGTANIALLAEKNIIPVIISCDPPSLRKNEKWYKIPAEGRVHITLRVGKTINVSPFADGNRPLAARRLTQFLENYFQREILENEKIGAGNQRIDYRMSGSRRYNT